MQIQYTGQNFDITDAIRAHVEKKFDRLKPAMDRATGIHVILEVEKLRQIAEANISVPGTQINAKAESEDMYKTIDLLVEKLNSQLTRYKEKQSDR